MTTGATSAPPGRPVAPVPDPFVGPAAPLESGGPRRLFHSAIHYRDFRVLWIGMMLSFVAFQMQQVVLGYVVFDLTGSTVALGAIAVAWGIPQVALTLVGGAVADRLPKKQLLLTTQLVMGLSALGMAILLATGLLQLWHLVVFGLIQGTTFSFNGPARTSFLPTVVPRERIANAIALNTVGMNVSRSFGPLIAGGLLTIAWAGPAAVYFLMAALYALVQVTLRLVRNPGNPAPVTVRRSILGDVRDGVGFLARSPLLRRLVLLSFVPTFMAMPISNLMAAHAAVGLGVDAAGLGALFTAGAVGSIVGSLLIAYFSMIRRKGLVLLLTGVGVGLGLLALGLSPWFWGAMAAQFFIGLCLDAYWAQNSAILMTATPPDKYGRVMAIVILSFSAAPFAALPAGFIAAWLGTGGAFALNGVLVMAIMAGAILFMPLVRTMGIEGAGTSEPARVSG